MGGNIDGMYSEVTIVDGVTSDFLMARDETFGPVAPIMTFGDIDECLRIANETPYGLQGAAFTSSLRTAFLLGEGIECGTVLINETNNCWDQLSPFGGVQEERPGPRAQRLVLRRAHRGQAAQHRHQQGEVEAPATGLGPGA